MTVPLRPVRLVARELVVDERPPDSELRRRLVAVLGSYGVPVTERDGELLVSEQIAADLELCWNYTTKALDEEWLREHVARSVDGWRRPDRAGG